MSKSFVFALDTILAGALLVSAVSTLSDTATAGSFTVPRSSAELFVQSDTCAGLTVFENWLGNPTGTVGNSIYLPWGDSISQLQTYLAGGMCGVAGRPLEVSVSLSDSAGNILAGRDDAYFRNLGTALSVELPNAIVRIGWEFNGNWYKWGISTYKNHAAWAPAQYASVFQHVVTLIRSVSGTSGLKFDWSIGLCQGCANPEPAYPGDSYIDIISEDFYDNYSAATPEAAWSYYTTCSYCLNWQVSFAALHHKLLGFGEWGVGYGGGNLNDSQGAHVLTQTVTWMNAHGYLYFDYWNSNVFVCTAIDGKPSNCPGSYPDTVTTAGPPYQLPLSAATFLAAFRNSNPHRRGAPHNPE